MRDIAALTFDLDGTLVETAGEIAEAVNRTLADFGEPARPVAEITALIGNGLRELMLKLLARLYAERPERAEAMPSDAVLARLDAHYAITVGTTGQPYPGCVEALERLRAAGIKLACVTNKEGRYAERVLHASGIAPWFDLLIAGDTLPHKKPHATVLHHAAQTLGVPIGQLVHVGDSRTDVEAARNAGVRAWTVPYGYNAGEPVALCNPDRMFERLDEVAEHVLA
jgi:phosphoglycolate phosphatase